MGPSKGASKMPEMVPLQRLYPWFETRANTISFFAFEVEVFQAAFFLA
jgi:hypothetical protein